MKKIILASASPRRKELLNQVGIAFDIMPSDVDENLETLAGSPEEKARQLALRKASDIAGKIGEGLVLGADTIVVLDDKIFGKPKDDAEAYDMLDSLNGREHRVITGVALVDAASGSRKVSHEVTRVFFDTVSVDTMKAYVRTGEPRGKAGAYAVQGIGALLVKKIDGCYSNVVGLPLVRLKLMLREFGTEVLGS